jgi:hypothetical protein
MGKCVGSGLGNDDQVLRGREASTIHAEEFAREPFQSVSDHRIADSRAHGNTESRVDAFGRAPDDDEVFRVTSSTFALEREELSATADARRLREVEPLAHSLNPAASGESRQ